MSERQPPSNKRTLQDEPTNLKSPQPRKKARTNAEQTNSSRKERTATAVSTKNLDTASLATQLISYFGIKTAKDLLVFLKSPAGQSTTDRIAEQIALIENLHEIQTLQLQERESMRHRIMTFLFLAMMHGKKAEAMHLNEVIQQQIDKLLAHGKTVQRSDRQAVYTERTAIINTYQTIYIDLEQKLNTKLEECQKLEDAREAAEKQREEIKEKYSAYQDGVNTIVNEFDSLDEQKITKRINELSKKLKQDALHISNLLDSDNPEDELQARKELIKSNTVNLQIATLKEMMAAIKPKNDLLTNNGEKTSSYKNAAFVVPNDKKIVKQGETWYLIPSSTQNIEEYLNNKSPSEKTALRVKPDELPVKHLVTHNNTLETRDNEAVISQLNTQSNAMQPEIIMLAQQLSLMQAAQASAEQALKQTDAPIPTPAPTARPSVSNQPASTHNISSTYRHVLQLMKYSPTELGIKCLKGVIDDQYLSELKPGELITPDKMKPLLANIERFSVDASKPNVSASINPTQHPEETPPASPQFHPKPKGF